MKKIALLNLLVFLAAFLLFQIELIAAKILLPQYGGSYMVWGACMVFFQAALLGGYGFSHLLLSAMKMSRYRILHVILMVIPLLFFPGRDFVVTPANDKIFLAADVFIQLLLTVGPVFFVLSTVSIVAQVWLAQSDLPQKDNPYTLYAWSNFGSFAALLSYPFVFEFFFDQSIQLLIWKATYYFLIGLSLWVCFAVEVKTVAFKVQEKVLDFNRQEIFRWVLLSAAGVMMFLSVTNILTMVIAPFPLLWIIPLGIYLVAFVLNFKRVPWCPAWMTKQIYMFIGLGVLFYLFQERAVLPIVFKMLGLFGLLFIYCMYCQNQLAASRPTGNKNLTAFYFFLSLGGFVGGVVTTWLMPLVAHSLLEFVLGLLIIALTTVASDNGRGKSSVALMSMAVLIVTLFLWPLAFFQENLLGFFLIVILVLILLNQIKSVKNAFALTMILLFMLTPSLEVLWGGKTYLYKKRNYYGICKVFDYGGVRSFMHGTTLHGMQSLDPALAMQPTSYFGAHSPVADVLKDESFARDHIGIVGLGAGTLAAYGGPGQKIDFYELDPEVYRIANRFFTFIKNSPAKISYFLGDARLALDKNTNAKYDILIIDAFSGDSIPSHLLTKEMLAICREHLSENGIILFHVTNRYLKAGLIAGRSASALNAHFCYKSTGEHDFYELHSDWVAVTWSDGRFERLVSRFGWDQRQVAKASAIRLWTDQYSNIIAVLKIDEFLNFFKGFRAVD